MSQSPNVDPRDDEVDPGAEDMAEIQDDSPAHETETWRPPRGKLFFAIAWILLVVMALCVAAWVIFFIVSLGKRLAW